MKRIFFRICLAVFALLVVSFMVWRVNLAHDVNAKLQAIRAAGLPTSGAEANDYYVAVPDNENSALKMAGAFALMTNYPDRRSNEVVAIKVPPRKDTLTPEQLALVSGFCAMNSNALVQTREAIKLPRCRYPIDLSWGAATLLPHLAQLKTMSRIAAFQSLLDTNESSGTISAIIGMARTLDKEPLLISKLVRIAIFKMAEAALERRLNAGSLSETDLNHLGELFADVDNTNQIANGLIGERAMYIPYFRMSWAEINRISESDENNKDLLTGRPLPGPQPILFRVTGFFERDLLYYLQTMQTNIAFASQQPPQSLLVTNFQNKMYEELKHKYCILSALLLPALGNAVIREADELACIRATQTAVAIERFRLVHGQLPENLNELVPQFLSAVPSDPFDGAPLRYHRLAKGYVIYSVGRDGHDDGGREKPADWKSSDKTTYDITFTVER